MGYISNSLTEGEYIVYQTKIHWIVFLKPVMGLIGVIYVISQVSLASGIFLLILDTLWFVWQYFYLRLGEFGVTNKRVILKVGVLRRKSLDLILSEVGSIGVDEEILGRILGYGTIVVTTGGDRQKFPNIVKPLEFRKRVQEQKNMSSGDLK